MMKRICIVGVGLIGGSIGIDVKRLGLARKVVGVVRRKESIAESVKLGAVDHATLDISFGIKDADFIILAAPISKIFSLAEKIKSKAVIIDVASVKGRLVSQLEKILGGNYVGTHPMAGSEKRGVASACAGLFTGATCIVTPTKNTKRKAISTVMDFWQKIGAKVITLSVDEHDKLVALTSHMPHLVAASLVNSIGDNKKAVSCIGPGFRDSTRIAASSPELWREICEWNKTAILASLKRFRTSLSDIEGLINSGNWDGLLNKLKKAKDLRQDKWK